MILKTAFKSLYSKQAYREFIWNPKRRAIELTLAVYLLFAIPCICLSVLTSAIISSYIIKEEAVDERQAELEFRQAWEYIKSTVPGLEIKYRQLTLPAETKLPFVLSNPKNPLLEKVVLDNRVSFQAEGEDLKALIAAYPDATLIVTADYILSPRREKLAGIASEISIARAEGLLSYEKPDYSPKEPTKEAALFKILFTYFHIIVFVFFIVLFGLVYLFQYLYALIGYFVLQRITKDNYTFAQHFKIVALTYLPMALYSFLRIFVLMHLGGISRLNFENTSFLIAESILSLTAFFLYYAWIMRIARQKA